MRYVRAMSSSAARRRPSFPFPKQTAVPRTRFQTSRSQRLTMGAAAGASILLVSAFAGHPPGPPNRPSDSVRWHVRRTRWPNRDQHGDLDNLWGRRRQSRNSDHRVPARCFGPSWNHPCDRHCGCPSPERSHNGVPRCRRPDTVHRRVRRPRWTDVGTGRVRRSRPHPDRHPHAQRSGRSNSVFIFQAGPRSPPHRQHRQPH